ncbi:hypothetical protein MMC09_006307 [Bachmanniomyces sp. S44760]|nr:hypothetical protein [Bachmanniomyces sp. S44760]
MRVHSFDLMAFGLVATLTSPVNAYWRMPCPGTLVTERLDPIVAPGKASTHAHTVLGGNAFAATMDYDTTQKSTCSSCSIAGDQSNYWIPTLYYRSQNGSLTSVDMAGNGQGGTVYYFQNRASSPLPGVQPQAFPKGFRMTAGNPELRAPSAAIAGMSIDYACIDYNAHNPEVTSFPNMECPDGLRAQVFFPSCWVGNNVLDSADHQSHVAYPVGGYNGGVCPASHPYPLVSIFYEFLYDVNPQKYPRYGSGQPFVWSMGDTTGYGLHGDFINGWQGDLLQNAMDTCNSNDTGIADNPPACPVLAGVNANADTCHIAPTLNEQTVGLLEKLPGCNTIDGEAAPANCPATPALPAAAVAPASSASGDKAISGSSSSAVGVADDVKTPIPPIATAPSASSASVSSAAAPTSTLPASIPNGGSPSPSTNVTLPSGWTSTGCYLDALNPRSLQGHEFAWWGQAMTSSGCAKYCDGEGFSMAGTENAGQCFCGNELVGSSKEADGDCNLPCVGDAGEICGGPARLSVFSKGGKTSKRGLRRHRRAGHGGLESQS